MQKDNARARQLVSHMLLKYPIYIVLAINWQRIDCDALTCKVALNLIFQLDTTRSLYASNVHVGNVNWTVLLLTSHIYQSCSVRLW